MVAPVVVQQIRVHWVRLSRRSETQHDVGDAGVVHRPVAVAEEALGLGDPDAPSAVGIVRSEQQLPHQERDEVVVGDDDTNSTLLPLSHLLQLDPEDSDPRAGLRHALAALALLRDVVAPEAREPALQLRAAGAAGGAPRPPLAGVEAAHLVQLGPDRGLERERLGQRLGRLRGAGHAAAEDLHPAPDGPQLCSQAPSEFLRLALAQLGERRGHPARPV
mmetsp:Transcript_82921/g.216438  ORF Transcript_82921/g.216438 Transcript_82921/m.216438 type:complete len:219 (+) Transcript_82921:154-810(+)